MSVKADCRHYVMQTVRAGERTERCRLGVAETVPFACPEDCLFYEARKTATSGWQVRARGDEGPAATRPK
ncbi:MAG: hypothetical protein ABSD97_11040 [Acidimicrobiales bacterium]